MKKRIVKVFKTISTIFITFFFVMSMLFMVSSSIASSHNEIINIGGYHVFVVASDSMEPTLKVNDIFIARAGNDDLEENMIVTYKSESGIMKGNLITHRLISIDEENDKYICKGDKEGADQDVAIRKDQIIAVFVKKLDSLSFVYRVVSSPGGFFGLIIGPIVIIFIFELRKMIKNIAERNIENKSISGVEKQKYLEEMKNAIKEELKNNIDN